MRKQRANRPSPRKSSPTGRGIGSNTELPDGERVYQTIKEAILSEELPPNSRLVELSLASHFGVSRTPVREALKRLIVEGLAVIDPPRGMVVKPIDQQEMEEIYAVREVLDGLAARLAAKRMSDEDLARLTGLTEVMSRAVEEGRRDALVQANIRFHEIIFQAAGNERLLQLGRNLTDSVRRSSSTAFRSYERDMEVLQEHGELVNALEQRDAEAAERLAREHMVKARTYLARSSVTADLVAEKRTTNG